MIKIVVLSVVLFQYCMKNDPDIHDLRNATQLIYVQHKCASTPISPRDV